mgnify:CR=1 FL=1
MLQSLPEPDFSSCSQEELLFAVLKEMHQTNFLECYHKRFERTGIILTKWNERSQQIAKEEMEKWST